MKKLLLAVGMLPLVVSAQQYTNAGLKNANDIAVPVKPGDVYSNENISPVRLGGKLHTGKPGNQAVILPETQIGVTYYDLMTNAAMPRRVKLYPGGKVSVVWTSSNTANDNTFLDRGTAYNHYDGTSWIGQNQSRFEPERAGWPNIVSYNDGTVEQEYITSHYASGGTGVSGGTFWMKNTGIGKSDFTTYMTKEKPNGPLWPRMAITGSKLHVIAVYQTDANDNTKDVVKAGVRTPIVYYRYDLATSTLEADAITLPGYDSTRYGASNADEYSMDARGDVIAIVIGGMVNDVALYKSMDGGQNWTKTIVDSFAHAPFDAARKNNPAFGDKAFDTAWSNDGSVHVVLDKDNNAHVFYPRMRVLNADESDAGYSYFPGTNGILYWNDKTGGRSKLVAGTPDIDGDQQLNIKNGTTNTSLGGYSSGLATFPMAAIGEDNAIFLTYSAPNEMDLTADEETNFRDIFLVYSRDGGDNWSNIMQLTGGAASEDVFPNVARDMDNNLHLVWMRDEQPGIFLVNNLEIVNNAMMYTTIDTSDIYSGALGMKEMKKPVFQTGSVYPNPASGLVNIPVTLTSSAGVSVTVTDMVGKTLFIQNNTMLPSGPNVLSIGVENLNPGFYFCQISAGGQTVTKKIVVQ
jgi:hypothetical protein